MGAKKHELFDNVTNKDAELAFSISSAARIFILKFLLKKGIVNGPILDDLIPLHRKTLNQHIKILERVGLIQGFYIGKFYFWRIRPGSDDLWKKIEWALSSNHGQSAD